MLNGAIERTKNGQMAQRRRYKKRVNMNIHFRVICTIYLAYMHLDHGSPVRMQQYALCNCGVQCTPETKAANDRIILSASWLFVEVSVCMHLFGIVRAPALIYRMCADGGGKSDEK